MAEIRQYVSNESPYAEIGGRGASARDFAGADFSGFAAELGNAGDNMLRAQTEQDVSDVHVKMSEARAKWTTDLLKRSQTDDVNNPDFADKFVTQFHDETAKIGDGIQTKAGQRAFQQGLADMTATFSGSAGVYQVQAAGVKAKNDYMTYLNNNQLTLFHDPAQFDAVSKEAAAALNDPSGIYATLQPSVREALARTGANDLAKSAFMGLIDRDPAAAKKDLEAGLSPMAKSLDADSVVGLISMADQNINAARIDAARVDEANRRAQADARDNTLNGFITKMVEDPTSVSAKDVVNSNLKPEQRIAVLGWIQKGLTGQNDANKADTQNAIFNELFARVHLPDGDPDKITDPDVLNDYVSNDVLRMDQLNTLRGEIGGRGTDADNVEKAMKDTVMDTARAALVAKDPITRLLDPNDQEGQRLMAKFTIQFLNDYAAGRAANKTPTQLTDPDSPDYVGKGIDILKKQRKTMPGLGLGTNGLLAPDAATPQAAPTAETKVIGGVTYTKNPTDGKWYK